MLHLDMKGLFLAVSAGALLATLPLASADATCAGCSVVVGLVGQIVGKGVPPNEYPWNAAPETFCNEIHLCDTTNCAVWGSSWPVSSPDFPTDGKKDDTAPDADNSTSTAVFRGVLSQKTLAMMKPMSFVDEHAVVQRVGADGRRKIGQVHPELQTPLLWLAARSSRLNEASNLPGVGLFGGIARVLAQDVLSAAAVELTGSLPCEDLLNVTCDVHTLFDAHLPLADSDGDTHPAGDIPLLTKNLRGTSWRGRDCDDTRGDVYPGRKATGANADATADTNCNGIWGVDPSSGQSYESLWCSGADAPMGVVGIGDSAMAHFHIPPQYLNAMNFSLDHVLDAASNELDWPQCSWITGYRDTDSCPDALVPMSSLYQRMVARNPCMHRDYTSVAVNGARVGSAASDLIPEGLKRNRMSDAPVLLIYALIGNDVCNGHNPTVPDMTTPAEFAQAVTQSILELNSTLPAGSHVGFIGLADGLILYDTMHNQTHPLGVDYTTVYDALTCNDCNPCNGWLSSNDTLRQITQARANNLTSVYDTVIQSLQGRVTFDMYRIQLDWAGLFKQFEQKFGNPRAAIEPVDGFHPSQSTHQLLAEQIWNDIEANRPSWLPRQNPHAADILSKFGDQGGY
jgi:acyloxyacyl hydrolase